MNSHKTSHMDATITFIRYVKGTAGLGLLMPADDKKELTVLCESN